MSFSAFLDRWHQRFGRSRVCAELALKARNQASAVLKYRLGASHDPNINGERWLIERVAPRNSRFVDVGANVGEWAALWTAADRDVRFGLLLDASQAACNAARNRFRAMTQIEVVCAGISDRAGSATFYEVPGAGELSSFVPCAADAVPTERPVTTLDVELEKRSIDTLDFLKIDVEGYDLHVMRGVSSHLARQSIDVIQFEYNAAWAVAGSTLAAAHRYLRGFGYSAFLLNGQGLWRLDYEKYGEFFSYSNFVALSPHVAPRLAPHIRGTL